MTAWFAEINDEVNRNKFAKNLNVYLKTFEPEYIVICDETNNTPETIDENKLIIDIYEKIDEDKIYYHEFIMEPSGVSVITANVEKDDA